ncbi:hypothetical protein RFI_39732 [Reticulomyxa filosa]|uniref:Uncharacterized protein n=1 Tax=Reticulomyxa filosa TaxID=46433 RepID=X6L8L0_RETFI|nr:hypothetical protein RFI_39732 [Reticulomyxa filosa]|eukprot:ETN97793.1 hypothetical protein RFI_39732 [Reticulomyxa filosa]
MLQIKEENEEETINAETISQRNLYIQQSQEIKCSTFDSYDTKILSKEIDEKNDALTNASKSTKESIIIMMKFINLLTNCEMKKIAFNCTRTQKDYLVKLKKNNQIY